MHSMCLTTTCHSIGKHSSCNMQKKKIIFKQPIDEQQRRRLRNLTLYQNTINRFHLVIQGDTKPVYNHNSFPQSIKIT